MYRMRFQSLDEIILDRMAERLSEILPVVYEEGSDMPAHYLLNLDEALDWLNKNGEDGGIYKIYLNRKENLCRRNTFAKHIKVTLCGLRAAGVPVRLKGSVFKALIASGALTIGKRITPKGRAKQWFADAETGEQSMQGTLWYD